VSHKHARGGGAQTCADRATERHIEVTEACSDGVLSRAEGQTVGSTKDEGRTGQSGRGAISPVPKLLDIVDGDDLSWRAPV